MEVFFYSFIYSLFRIAVRAILNVSRETKFIKQFEITVFSINNYFHILLIFPFFFVILLYYKI